MARHKWILLTAISGVEFRSLTMNRDVWKRPDIQALVDAHFVFVQIDLMEVRNLPLARLFQISEDDSRLPFMGIINPRTNIVAQRWEGRDFNAEQTMDKCLLCICIYPSFVVVFWPSSDPDSCRSDLIFNRSFS